MILEKIQRNDINQLFVSCLGRYLDWSILLAQYTYNFVSGHFHVSREFEQPKFVGGYRSALPRSLGGWMASFEVTRDGRRRFTNGIG